MDERTLVVHDADRIQEFISSAPRLREIRGASALVDSLTMTTRDDPPHVRARQNAATFFDTLLQEQGLTDDQVVYAGGGNIAVWLPDADAARRFDQAYTGRFYQKTGGEASTTGGMALYSDEKRFGQARQAAEDRAKEQKSRGAGPPFLAAGGLLRPCGFCARRPSSEYVPDPDEPGSPGVRVCSACFLKHQFPELPRIYHRFFDSDREWNRRHQLIPRFFEDISASAPRRLTSYLGVIYCDGNGVGDYIRNNLGASATAEKFTKFSRTLDRITRESAVETLREHFPAPVTLEREEKTSDGKRRTVQRTYYPFQFLLCGGDDLIVVVPAHLALPIAADFIDRFAAKCEREGLPLTTSAGVVVAKDRHPFRDLQRIARELMKSAKRRTRSTADKPGCLDALTLTASGALDLESERLRAYSTEDNRIDLVPGPVTVPEYRRYAGALRRIADGGLAASKLYGIYRGLWDGYLPAFLRYCDTYGRGKDSERNLFDALSDTFELENGPWQVRAKATDGTLQPYRSPFIRLAEWYELFASGGGTEGEAEDSEEFGRR